MKTSQPAPLAPSEGAFARIRGKIRSSVRLSGCVRMLMGVALLVLPILLLAGLAKLGIDQRPLVQFLVKWTFGLLALFALVAGGVAVLQGLIELITGVQFGWLSAKWDKLGRRGQVVLGLAIYVVVLVGVLWLLVRATAL